ncbi:hypothetical protein FOA52_010876 [Chlamydomonas sp. UWO 241]|nr:hypothetical protein FOA52_010876 [Chlamydomonas sp. UWO 241]
MPQGLSAQAIAPVVEDPSLFDVDALATILGLLKEGLVGFQPLNHQHPSGAIFAEANPFKPPIERTRGGVASLYSQPFHQAETSTGGKFNISSVNPLLSKAGLPSPYVSPFKSILAISNGMCGSTCSTWGLTSWLHSKTTPDANSFKWPTYGGTGHEANMQPMSYMGGFLDDSASGEPETPKLWAYWLLFSLLGEWLGDAELAGAAAELKNKIPDFPALGNDATLPHYPQGKIFSYVLGGAAGSAPAEYLQWPNDHYLQRWYLSVDDVSARDIWTLYADAEAFLPAA